MNLVGIENMYIEIRGQFNISRLDILILYMVSKKQEVTYQITKSILYDRAGVVRRIKKLKKEGFINSKMQGKCKVLSLTEKGNVVIKNINGYKL